MVGIIGAMEMEIAQIRDLMKITQTRTICGVVYDQGTIFGKEVVLARCGVGKVNAALCTQGMLLQFAPTVIVNPGVAGGIGDGVKIGDVVMGTSCVQYDMDTTALGDPRGTLFTPIGALLHIPCDQQASAIVANLAKQTYEGTVHQGVIATGDQFVADPAKCQWLQETFGAIACEMEGGAIAHACFMAKVPFVALRTISDNANHSGKTDFMSFAKYSAEKAASLLGAVILQL